MKLLDMYSYILANWLNSGEFNQRGKMQASDIIPEYNVIFTKGAIKKIYKITGLKPDNIDMAFLDYIRERMFELNPDVETVISVTDYPTKIDVNNEKFQRQMARASESYTSYREAFDSQSGLARLTGKTYRLAGGGRVRLSKDRLDNLRQIFLSYYYLYNHISSGGTVTLTNIFIEVIGKDMRSIKRAGDDLYGLLGPLYVGVSEVTGVLKTYLSEFGPAVTPPVKMNKKFLPQLLFTEENTTAWSTYKSRGLVGDKGLLLGMDIRSRLPLSINIFKASSAQVFMVNAKTGSGKTYMMFQVAMSALALGEYVTVIDVKGREWVQLSVACKPKIISLDDKHPSFVNTLRLDDLDMSIMDPHEMFNTAIKGTVAFLSLIVNLQQGEGNPNDLELVLREAVTKLYSIRGVDPINPKSFANTKGIKYAEVLNVLEDLSTTKTYTEEQKRMLFLARSRVNAYLGDSGIFSEAFQNEISLSDVLESPFVIFELNKNQSAMTEGSLDTLRVFMIQFLDSKKKAALKSRGKFLFSFYEELQRSESFGNLLEYICSDVTGSRSNNAVVFCIMNSLKILRGDRARDIRSNITSFLIGNSELNDITTYREEFGQDWLASQLELFAEKPNLYRNCFTAVVDTGAETLQTVFKVILPTYLSEAFRTRTIKTD